MSHRHRVVEHLSTPSLDVCRCGAVRQVAAGIGWSTQTVPDPHATPKMPQMMIRRLVSISERQHP